MTSDSKETLLQSVSPQGRKAKEEGEGERAHLVHELPRHLGGENFRVDQLLLVALVADVAHLHGEDNSIKAASRG